MSETIDSASTLTEVPEVSLATIIESIPDGVIVAEFTSGEIVAANEAAGELFDCRTESLVGLNHLQLHPAGDGKLYEEAFYRGFENKQVERLEDGSPLYVETLSGVQKPVEINARRIQTEEQTLVLGVFRDISGRIDREQQLEAATTRLNTLLDSSPLPVAVLDSHGRVQLWNQAAEETFGYTSPEVLGDQYPLFVDDDQLDDLLGRVLAGGTLEGYETVTRAKDGSRVNVELYARPLYEDGEITGVIGSAVDITTRKRQSQHLDVLHRFLRHNLRNKLSIIQGHAGMLVDESERTNISTRESGERIVAASEELDQLSKHASQVRDVVKASKTAPTSVSKLLDSISAGETEVSELDIRVPEEAHEACVPGRAINALSWLLDHMGEYTDEGAIDVTAAVRDRYIQLDISGAGPLLSEGDAELITRGEETALKHGSNLDIARAYLILTGIGGDILQPDNAVRRTFRVEVPRTDCGVSPRLDR